VIKRAHKILSQVLASECIYFSLSKDQLYSSTYKISIFNWEFSCSAVLVGGTHNINYKKRCYNLHHIRNSWSEADIRGKVTSEISDYETECEATWQPDLGAQHW